MGLEYVDIFYSHRYVLESEGLGCIAFSPLAQGLLTTKYLDNLWAASSEGG